MSGWHAAAVAGGRYAYDTYKDAVPMGSFRYGTPPCVGCGKPSKIVMPIQAYNDWKSGGMTVQTAFPKATPEEVELILNGTHLKCWDELYGEPA